MKKLIIKSNKWYDNLPEPKRTLFFLVFVLGTLITAQYFMYARNVIWAFPVWAGVICSWRLTYFFLNEKQNSSRFFVVWEEELGKYQYMTTAWTKEDVNGVKTYDWNTWKQKGFKWEIISEHKNIEAARIECERKNKNNGKNKKR